MRRLAAGSERSISLPSDKERLTGGPARGHGRLGAPRTEIVLDRLLKAHEAWYDVSRDRTIAGRTFRGFAEYREHAERYVLVRRAKLWEVDVRERIFFDTAEHLDECTLANAIDFMKADAVALAKPAPNQMSSNLALVVIAESTDADARRLARKTRYRKNFAWGFGGWSDLRIAIVDLSARGSERIVTNAAGKALRKPIEANLDDPAETRPTPDAGGRADAARGTDGTRPSGGAA